MAKKTPNLRLIAPGGEKSIGSRMGPGWSFLSLDELEEDRKKWVERVVHDLHRDSSVIGVGTTSRSWDIRPVVVVPDEGFSSIIRFLGPSVFRSETVSGAARDQLNRLHQLPQSRLTQWGEFHGQLWYRREFVDNTLADYLESENSLTFAEGFFIAENVISALEHWHSLGVVHGHLTLGNIGIRQDGEIVLLDFGTGVAIVSAARFAGADKEQHAYRNSTFPPELIEEGQLITASDIFCLGRVLKQLFTTLRREDLERFQALGFDVSAQLLCLNEALELCDQMSHREVSKRPALIDVENTIARLSKIGRKYLLSSDRGAEVEEEMHLQQRKKMESAARSEEFAKAWGQVKQRFNVDPVAAAGSAAADSAADSVAVESGQASKPDTQLSAKRRKKGVSPLALFTVFILVILVTVAGGKVLRRLTGPAMSAEELRFEWSTMLPSRMMGVIEEAILKDKPDYTAQAVIVNSARTDRRSIEGFDAQLLRTAFDDRWVGELSDDDRRAAIALSLVGLLKESFPSDLASLDSLHPGVILALSASPHPAASKALKIVPASALGSLPPPIGPAFVKLIEGRRGLNCGDTEMRQLAKLATYGAGTGDLAISFLSTDAAHRLQVVASLFSQSSVSAKNFLVQVVSHPNAEVELEAIAWAKSADILNWGEMEDQDKLLLVAGISPSYDVDKKHLVHAFGHPNAKARGWALSRAVERISFAHPASYDVLKMLAQNPSSLDPRHTVVLGRFLESPKDTKSREIKRWLERKPPLPLISKMLLGATKETEDWPMNAQLLTHLQLQGWQPGLSELETLLRHPNALTRLFAYKAVFDLQDRQKSLELLSKAKRSERNSENYSLLRDMLEVLKEN